MNNKYKYCILIFLIIYGIVSFSTITIFPFVHSDEAWLAGLSNTIITETTIDTTESFFDLYPRNPHAIKVLFNFVQMFFIQVFGLNITAMRLISLIFSLISSYLFNNIVYSLTKSKSIAFFSMLLFIINIQFIYMSHFARQESILLFLLLLNIAYLYKSKKPLPLVSGLISSVGVGIHPNSFIIFLPILAYWILGKKIKDIVIYLLTLSFSALLFILWSFSLDPNFINNYLNYGDELGVKMTLIDKAYQIKYFYLKLYYGISGTYYTPNIKAIFYISILTILSTLYLICKRKIKPNVLICFIAINIGYIFIGRYNQTSIIFIIPFIVLMISEILLNIDKKHLRNAVIVFILLIISINTFVNMNNHYYSETYDDYLNNLELILPENAVVLGNLNTLFAFNTNRFYDYRNLGYLPIDKTFANYIYERNIEYIIYPEEMDFIYNTRPLWNGLYGNVYPYYEDMKNFFDNSCTIVGNFNSPVYGMRIVRYIEDKEYNIVVYKVK
ncbi:MAG: glycosyltransferase family 39 protein [Bacillota bacterium]|nr:glycosyltransferase family 39 protein [Bacillota bacterium]